MRSDVDLQLAAHAKQVRLENAQLREQNRVLRDVLKQALDDIPGWVMLASEALTATSQPAKPQGRMHACDIPGCVSCGNPEPATSQEGQHGSR